MIRAIHLSESDEARCANQRELIEFRSRQLAPGERLVRIERNPFERSVTMVVERPDPIIKRVRGLLRPRKRVAKPLRQCDRPRSRHEARRVVQI